MGYGWWVSKLIYWLYQDYLSTKLIEIKLWFQT
jgi:hypothetical protein